MRTALFWVTEQQVVVITVDVSGQPIGSITSRILEPCEGLCRNVGMKFTTTC